MSVVDGIRDQALALNDSDRASLARDLLLSLEHEAHADAQQAWKDEILARSDAIARGEFTASDWRESIQRIRDALAQRNRSLISGQRNGKTVF
jgi:hypothetical protein